MANQINHVTCASCGRGFRVDKPLLYNDPGHGFMVYWLPMPESRAAEAETEFRRLLERLGQQNWTGPIPLLHLVLDRIELVERIFLLEASLDVRIIEYIKYLIYSKNLERLDPRHKRLLFDAQDSDEAHLVFVVQDTVRGQLETIVHYRRDAYRALCEAFDEDHETARLLELFPGPYFSARRLLHDAAGSAAAPAEESPSPGS